MKKTVFAGVLLAAVLASGCSDSSSDDSAAAPSMSSAVQTTTTSTALVAAPATTTDPVDLASCISTSKFEPNAELEGAVPADKEVKLFGVQTTADSGGDQRVAAYYYLCAPAMLSSEQLQAYGDRIAENVRKLPVASTMKSVSLYNFVGGKSNGHIRCLAPEGQTFDTLAFCQWKVFTD